MSKVKTKAKIKKKSKLSTKAKASVKAKVKKKTKPKAKAKTKAKAKPRVKAKATSKAKTKTKAKTKAKTKTKATPKIKTKKKSSAKIKAKAWKFSETQTVELLMWIEKIVNLHKGKQGGLKSFTSIDKILDKYNQRYTETDEKFDAIVKFGMEEDPRVIHEHVFVNVEGREKDMNDLYILLADISKGKIDFSAANEKMKSIYETSLAVNK